MSDFGFGDSSELDRLAADSGDFAAVVERYQMAVYSYLRARVLQDSDAEDLTQEVFMRYYAAADRFDSSREVRPYLLGIARNLLRERARTLKRRNEVAWTELCMEVEEPEEDEGPYDDDVNQRLELCMEELGENARYALEMHYTHRLKIKEIARYLERSVGAVKLLMYRARQALKRCLMGHGGDDDFLNE